MRSACVARGHLLFFFFFFTSDVFFGMELDVRDASMGVIMGRIRVDIAYRILSMRNELSDNMARVSKHTEKEAMTCLLLLVL